jgi:hypothetical protein
VIATAAGSLAATPTVQVFRIHDVVIEVRSDVTEIGDVVGRSYAVFAADGPLADRATATRIEVRRTGTGFSLRVDDGPATMVPTVDAGVLGTLDRIVTAVLGALDARGILATHAGVVTFGGRAVLLAGPSGRGKSTLSLAMLRDGASLLTDEMALIDPAGPSVLPYPRALHVSPATVDLLPELAFLHERPRRDLGGESEWSVSMEDLAIAFGTRIARAAPLSMIVLLGPRLALDDTPTLEPLPPAVATMELLRGTPMVATDFAGTMRRVAAIVGSIPTYRLRAAEPIRTAALVRDRLLGTT